MSINDKFEKALMENLGAEALLNEKLSPYQIFERGYKAATAQSHQELARQALRIEELENALYLTHEHLKLYQYYKTNHNIYDSSSKALSTPTTTTHLDDYVMSRLNVVGERCDECRKVQMLHCCDPVNCGNSYTLYRLKESDK